MKSWPIENSNLDKANEENFEYYIYRLSRPVICTINFRCYIMQGSSSVKIVPIKCGEGHKYTQEGVLRVPIGFNPHHSSYFKRVRIMYSQATLAEFECASQRARIKIYFRGFPLETSREEIGNFFSYFGKLEYLYIMAMSKSRLVQKSVQGYVIFQINDHAHLLLSQREDLVFNGLNIFCEIYKTNKKKKCLSEPKLPEFGFSPKEIIVSTPGSAPGKISKDKFIGVSVPKPKGLRERISFAPSYEDDLQNPSSKAGLSRPFLENLDSVKVNSKDQTNIRFNICKKRVAAQIPNWGRQLRF